MAKARGHKTVTAPDAAAGGIDALMRERAKNLMQGMILALQSGLAGSWRPLLGELVGFGPGLTPSGDDFLLGLLAASHAFQSDQRDAIEFDVAALVADGAQATVRQSQYMLNAALKGHFPEPVINLLVALGQSISEDVRKAARRLRGLGSASGQDMLAGILFRLDTCREPALSGAV
jgi:hypothetical protein